MPYEGQPPDREDEIRIGRACSNFDLVQHEKRVAGMLAEAAILAYD
jgi:hypothetical protein